jgi:glycosyltransferase involved in cell wall biosynthesis
MDKLVHHVTMLDQILERATDFDVLHFHIDYLHFLVSRYCHLPSVTTLHGRLDLHDLTPLYERFHDAPVISISYAQRKPLPEAHWIGNVYHGLPPRPFEPCSRTKGYLAFLARISPEKRPDRAIEIARATGRKLRIAAKVDPVDRLYYESEIKPLLQHPSIEFIGEIGDDEKGEFLGNAHALLFPIDWPEPFGLAIIEAMQCGTPTIAFNCGAISEILTDGVTGFVVNSVAEAIEAVRRVDSLDRTRCRKTFEERFTSARMAREYVALYERVVRSKIRVRPPQASFPVLSKSQTVKR